jgi:hypothetical protein
MCDDVDWIQLAQMVMNHEFCNSREFLDHITQFLREDFASQS